MTSKAKLTWMDWLKVAGSVITLTSVLCAIFVWYLKANILTDYMKKQDAIQLVSDIIDSVGEVNMAIREIQVENQTIIREQGELKGRLDTFIELRGGN